MAVATSHLWFVESDICLISKSKNVTTSEFSFFIVQNRELRANLRSRYLYSHWPWLSIFEIKDVNIDDMITAKDARVTLSSVISDRCLHVTRLRSNCLYSSINLLSSLPCRECNKRSTNSASVSWVLPLCSVAAYAFAHTLRFEGAFRLPLLGSVAAYVFGRWLRFGCVEWLPLLGFLTAYAFAHRLRFEGRV